MIPSQISCQQLCGRTPHNFGGKIFRLPHPFSVVKSVFRQFQARLCGLTIHASQARPSPLTEKRAQRKRMAFPAAPPTGVRSKTGVQIPIPRLATKPSPPTQRKVGAGPVPALCLSNQRPVGAGLVPALCPSNHRPVGAGLVPAQCLSQSRRTISATAGINSPPYYSLPKCGLHPSRLGQLSVPKEFML